METKSTTEGHLAVFTLSEDCSGAKGLTSLMSQKNTAGYRTYYGLDTSILKLSSHSLAKLLGVNRLLKYVKLFYVSWAMKTRGQQEVAFHDCAGLNEHILYFFFSQCL